MISCRLVFLVLGILLVVVPFDCLFFFGGVLGPSPLLGSRLGMTRPPYTDPSFADESTACAEQVPMDQKIVQVKTNTDIAAER